MAWHGRLRYIDARRLVVVGCLCLNCMHAHKGNGGSVTKVSDFGALQSHI